MNRTTCLAIATIALTLLTGCAAQRFVGWSNVPARDQHAFLPNMVQDEMRPTVIVTAGPTGLVVGTGSPAPAMRVIAQGNEIRLVSQETYAQMMEGTMGAPPASTAVPTMPAR